jgi:hypothetical protein
LKGRDWEAPTNSAAAAGMGMKRGMVRGRSSADRRSNQKRHVPSILCRHSPAEVLITPLPGSRLLNKQTKAFGFMI